MITINDHVFTTIKVFLLYQNNKMKLQLLKRRVREESGRTSCEVVIVCYIGK